jgi:hypothetical protein
VGHIHHLLNDLNNQIGLIGLYPVMAFGGNDLFTI